MTEPISSRRPRKLTIAVDVDGVIADFVGLVRRELNLPSDWEPRRWDVYEDPVVIDRYGTHGSKARLDVLFSTNNIALDIPIYANEADALYDIINRHTDRCEFVFATSPLPSCETWTSDRDRWLRVNGFPRVPVIHTGRKDLVDADILLDDKPENVVAFTRRKSGRVGVLHRRPWNVDATLADASRCVGSMVEFGRFLDGLFNPEVQA